MNKNYNNDIKCPICNSKASSVMIGKTELYNCNECELYFSISINDLDLIKFYTSEYKILKENNLNTEKRRIFRLPEQIRLISEISKYLPKGKNIIDIGSDKGFFLDEARRYGYKTIGVELSIDSRLYSESIGLSVVDSLEMINSNFDAAVLWHSLEHFHKPLELLYQIKDLLNNNGYIFIRVPNFNSFWANFLKDKWIWLQPKVHCFHYTKNSLRKILEKVGFEIIELRSQRASDNLNIKAFFLAKKLFNNYYSTKMTLKEYLSLKYQYLTGIELFCIAKIINK
jgi:SAM-dependent methyltransferase